MKLRDFLAELKAEGIDVVKVENVPERPSEPPHATLADLPCRGLVHIGKQAYPRRTRARARRFIWETLKRWRLEDRYPLRKRRSLGPDGD